MQHGARESNHDDYSLVSPLVSAVTLNRHGSENKSVSLAVAPRSRTGTKRYNARTYHGSILHLRVRVTKQQVLGDPILNGGT